MQNYYTLIPPSGCTPSATNRKLCGQQPQQFAFTVHSNMLKSSNCTVGALKKSKTFLLGGRYLWSVHGSRGGGDEGTRGCKETEQDKVR